MQRMQAFCIPGLYDIRTGEEKDTVAITCLEGIPQALLSLLNQLGAEVKQKTENPRVLIISNGRRVGRTIRKKTNALNPASRIAKKYEFASSQGPFLVHNNLANPGSGLVIKPM